MTHVYPSQTLVLIIVYISLLLDNILLTVVVPIVPDYLLNIENLAKDVDRFNMKLNSSALVLYENILDEENGRVGLLLSSKAVVQLMLNPIVGIAARYIGYTLPLFIGSVNLLSSTLHLFQCLRLVKHMFHFSLLEAYKALLQLVLVYQTQTSSASLRSLLSDGLIMISGGAIWISSSAMAVLEPCIPLWLMSTIKPEKWELGTVFIPDSVGYLIGTNFFGTIAYRLGRWRIAIAAMLLVAVSSLLVPTATSVTGLIIPHFGIGLGIGVVDAALVPLLATLVDCRHSASYSVVYALQQMAVSLAYALGPMLGGELAHVLGFPWLMRIVGFFNLLYCPLLVLLASDFNKQETQPVVNTQVNYNATQNYSRFNNSDESD
ncbi:putative mushroom body vesicular transporter portabella isoform X2 [Rhodnius prolixus]|uniref:putative mushroom body vesicular transporter portabella isoform X2 n=1 Tax=Rhodnius prolixus TaxID=13249 RepID=UPI003D189C8E